MKEFFRPIIMGSAACLICLQANAESNKTVKTNIPTKTETSTITEHQVTTDNFRCEKFREGGISELKLKMLENCDLNRPFSNSLSLFAGEETILYCCHKKTDH